MPPPSNDAWPDPAPYALPPAVLGRTLSPALVVFMDLVRINVARVLGAMDGDASRWRPHVKTVKIDGVAAELVRAGVRTFKCATTREARRLFAVLRAQVGGAGDVLVAHHVAGPAVKCLSDLAAQQPETRLSVLAEDPEVAAGLPGRLGVFVDVDPGMGRSGIPAADAGRVVAVAAAAGSRLRGVHFYDGHLAGLDADERRRRASTAYERLVALLDALDAAGLPAPEVVTSGTPTFTDALAFAPLRAREATVHRVSPGTVVYHDVRSQAELPALGLRPAAVVLTRVVSRPAPDRITCDAGSKSVAAEAGDPCAVVIGHPGLTPDVPSEEHLPLRVAPHAKAPPRGTTLLLAPRHVCPTVNLAETALLVDGGEVRVVEVDARAHDLGEAF